jgi:hypothetical protein
MKRTTKQILKEAQDTLYTAQLGFQLVVGKDAKARIAGLRNVVVFGRAVTNVLQNLRSSVGDDFNEWYNYKVNEMASDDIMKYFYKLRSQILKVGTINTSSSLTLSGNPYALMRLYEAPPKVKSFFIGDRIGGCGWEVEIEEGVTEPYYVEIPDNIYGLDMTIDVVFSDVPNDMLKQNIQEMCEYYLKYLEQLIIEAKLKFD